MLFILLTYGFGLMVNKRLHMAIQGQEEKYFRTFHSSPYAILFTRLSDGKIMEVNQGFVKITGYSCEEAVGQTTHELNLWAHEKDRATVIAQLAEGQEVRGAEFQIRKKSGEAFTALLSVVPITLNSEKCLLSSINDITERKCAEEERERLISEREKALSEVKILSGLLPICATCKKIRDDHGHWSQIESYVRKHSAAEFSHGICPECMQVHYAEFSEAEPNVKEG
jgi:PAS domain S-box-containing protein